MPQNLTDYEENRLLDLSWLTTDKLALYSVLGTDSTTGTEVVGGSYVRQTTSGLAAAASGSKASNAAIAFTMPAIDSQGWEIWDSAGTNRKWYGLFSQAAATAQDTGDTITKTAHGLANGTKIVFLTGYVPAGLAANTTYFVVTTAANTFQVAATLGGAAIAITADAASVYFGLVQTTTLGQVLSIASGAIAVLLS